RSPPFPYPPLFRSHGQPPGARRRGHRPGGVHRLRLRRRDRACAHAAPRHRRHARHRRGRHPLLPPVRHHRKGALTMPYVPLTWLAEHVAVPPGTTAADLAADLVRVGLEPEQIIPPAVTGPLVVGRVLSIETETHKNGK